MYKDGKEYERAIVILQDLAHYYQHRVHDYLGVASTLRQQAELFECMVCGVKFAYVIAVQIYDFVLFVMYIFSYLFAPFSFRGRMAANLQNRSMRSDTCVNIFELVSTAKTFLLACAEGSMCIAVLWQR